MTVEEPWVRALRGTSGSIVGGRITDRELFLIRGNGAEVDIGPVGGAAGRGATVVVAAYDSTDGDKAGADVVCTGVSDEILIQSVFDSLLPAEGSKVRLPAGTFNLTNYIAAEHFWIEGSGPGTLVQFENADGMPAIVPEIDGHVTNIQFFGVGVSSGTAAVGPGDIFTANVGGVIEDCWFYDCSVALEVAQSVVRNCYFNGKINANDYWYYGPIDLSSCQFAKITGNIIEDCHSVYTPADDFSLPIAIYSNAYTIIEDNIIVGNAGDYGDPDSFTCRFGYGIEASYDCVVSRNIFYNVYCESPAFYGYDRTTFIENKTYYLYILGLEFTLGTWGMVMDLAGYGCRAIGNTLYYSSINGVFPVLGIMVDGGYSLMNVSDNYFDMDATAGAIGILVTGYDFGNVVKGNTFNAYSAATGIYLDPTSLGNVVDLNIGNLDDLVIDDGTDGSNYVGPANMHNNIVP